MATIRILTLNCWGVPVPVVCKKRKERMAAIGAYLAKFPLDLAVLQEVWDKDDFAELCRLTSSSLPHTHYFFSGAVGSGCCVLSRYPIQDTIFHIFQLNGFAHKVFHGDWWGGKGVGLVCLTIMGIKVNLYATHTHAEYNVRDDEYEAHRLSQAFELSQFFRHTYAACHVAILAGDLNMEPATLGMRVLQTNTGLLDAWLDKKTTWGREEGFTYDCPHNVFATGAGSINKLHSKRIDYILYKPNLGTHVSVEECTVSANTIPETDINFSDHEAVMASLRVELIDQNAHSHTQPLPSERAVHRGLVEELMDAVVVVERRLEHMDCQTVLWWVMAVLLVAAVIACQATFMCPMAPFLALPMAFCFWMAIVIKRQERNGLRSTLQDLTTRLAAIQHKL